MTNSLGFFRYDFIVSFDASCNYTRQDVVSRFVADVFILK